ncbi:MAG: hypothetical protein A3G34_10110 [Candidatus Lindowbacteria bacterium RIFCSPLOWO2_12_FULL_62_27]|nr:MAG: hypothetical protein A3G34_10110 [Candidatus Lindowbacteria bacterium RIFCSPLOWO2_12_FULL_62_27]OGH61593.1 MAG: hypothetical protein A3I06_03120 [Candidatus Lindowbacteria bacterium RIFCSPLOWO2_02_FULL_62_12]
MEDISTKDLDCVEELLIRGIKLVNIYGLLMKKFPRGTDIIYFGSKNDLAGQGCDLIDSIPIPGYEDRRDPLFVFHLKLN